MIKRRLTIVALAVMGLSLALGPPAAALARSGRAPSCAGTSFKWTGKGDGASWANAKNWSPAGSPGNCDSVTIPIEANITGVPAIDLANLSVPASAGSNGTLVGGPITVSGHFQWDASTFDATIDLPAGSTAEVGGPAVSKGLGGGGLGKPGRLNVAGSLTFDNLSAMGGSLGLGAGNGRAVIDIQRTGVLTSIGQNSLGGASCCAGSDNPTLINDGQIKVLSGRLFAAGLITDQSGRLDAASRSVFDVDSPVVLGANTSYTGAGQMLLDLGAFPSTVQGALSLGRGFSLVLGPQACLDGAGTITGAGTFDFTGGYLPARLTIARGALMHVTGPGVKDLSTFACGTTPGSLTDAGRILVDEGTLRLGATGSLTTTRGGVLAIAPGATITAGRLLSNAGTVQLAARGAATVSSVRVSNTGTISVGAGQTLLLDGVQLTNAGTVAVARGLIKVNGSYLQQRAGRLAVTIDGGSAGTGFGQLAVAGAATLAGTLQVTVARGFTPRRGEAFNFLRYLSRSGRFTVLAGLPRYTVSYGRSGANVVY
jgi:fibronectin-binding autotransporter adhesin